MKRHMKLIFQILAYVESRKTNGNDLPLPELEDYSRSLIEHHIMLCDEAGYIDVVMVEKGQPPIAIRRLTWAGHNELDRMRAEGCC